MQIHSNYLLKCRVLIFIECLTLLLFNTLGLVVFINTPEPIIVLVFLIGLMILLLVLVSLISTYNDIKRSDKFLKSVSVSYVTLSNPGYAAVITVYSDSNKALVLRRIHKVYNKDIKYPYIDLKMKILYIPFSMDIIMID